MVKFLCECGSTMNKKNYKRHTKSNIHINFMKSKNDKKDAVYYYKNIIIYLPKDIENYIFYLVSKMKLYDTICELNNEINYINKINSLYNVDFSYYDLKLKKYNYYFGRLPNPDIYRLITCKIKYSKKIKLLYNHSEMKRCPICNHKKIINFHQKSRENITDRPFIMYSYIDSFINTMITNCNLCFHKTYNLIQNF